MNPHVLFVDDEPNVLSGLRRMLRSQRSAWRMSFAAGGQEALDIIGSDPADVVISDMRMPGMDGAELLERIAEDYPSTVRLVLSGQSDHERVMRVVGPAHQFLSKPCDSHELIRTIDRVRSLCDQLNNQSLHNIIGRIKDMPSLPRLYRSLVIQLQSDDASLDRVADLICEDMAMSAKVLQLVNSSFFGIASPVTCPKQAVSMLGLSLLRPLVLMAGVFAQYEGKPSAYSLEKAVHHGLAVATLARQIATEERLPAREIDAAYIAGMMHDLGKIVLGTNLPDVYQNVRLACDQEALAFWHAESVLLGTTHAEIGAHLLSLWGMPHSVVEAVAYHHQPSYAPHDQDQPGDHVERITPLAAVHLADGLVHASRDGESGDSWKDETQLFDRDYLSAIGGDAIVDRYWNLSQWKEVTQ